MAIGYSGRAPQDDVPYAYHATPASLAAAVDVLVCCAMGGPTTEGLIDRATIEALPPAASSSMSAADRWWISRPCWRRLRSRHIAAAGLDVFWNEPAIDPAFRRAAACRPLAPCGEGTEETRSAMGLLMRDNLAAHFAGRPLPTEIRP